jgi:predicted CXXCH cytochrome family protein
MRRSTFVCSVFFGLMSTAFAQDIDTAILSPSVNQFTILDQIERPKERKAFTAIYKKRDAGQRLEAARSFLSAYPDSWLLAEVYDIAAKACIDVGDFREALVYAKESMRLLPENPLLLVPVANVQIQMGLFREGERNARDALEYLDRFARPSSIRETDWPELKRQLQASSLYALARAELTVSPGRGHAAVADLTRAAQLNPNDAEIEYLLGLAQVSLDDRDSAARAFAAAARLPGPVQARALNQLRELHRDAADYPAAPAPSAPDPPATSPGRYAGSEVCRTCHSSQYGAWQQTGMARMFRPYRLEDVFGDFAKHNGLEEAAGGWPARTSVEGDRYYLTARGSDGKWERYPIDFTIGSKWQQAYATRLPNGEIHVFPIQYNKVERSWVNYWKIIDPPGSERANVGLFHAMGLRTNYQANCAPCHTSQLRTAKPGSTAPRDMVFSEGGVNCEMCHGPSAGHVEAMQAGKAYGNSPEDPPVVFAKLDNRGYLSICGQCHMQSAVREEGPQGEWNYSGTSKVFHARYTNRPLTDFSRRAFYKDGRLRETTFIGEAFMRSACYRRGQAQCGHCHNPHPADAATNPTSLKDRDRPDQMCLQCHTGYASRIEAHTHHPVSSDGSRCVNCHMPRIMNSLLFQARTHQIDDIPRADTALRFGQKESPNACLLCHQDKDGQWIASRLQSW